VSASSLSTATTPRVVLKARKALPFFNRHPWVFGGAIETVEGDPEPVVQPTEFLAVRRPVDVVLHDDGRDVRRRERGEELVAQVRGESFHRG